MGGAVGQEQILKGQLSLGRAARWSTLFVYVDQSIRAVAVSNRSSNQSVQKNLLVNHVR